MELPCLLAHPRGNCCGSKRGREEGKWSAKSDQEVQEDEEEVRILEPDDYLIHGLGGDLLTITIP